MDLRGDIGKWLAGGGPVLVLGYGRSGRAAVDLLAPEGVACRVAD